VIKDNFPELADRLPEQIPVPDGTRSFVIDTTPMKQILGIPFRSFKDCVVDTVKSLLEVKA
jgi:hypothetical protein